MNRLTGFQFANNVAHGALVELSEGVGEMLGPRAYGADVRALLGQAMAAMPLLATHLHFEGRINLQFQGEAARFASNARGAAERPAKDGRAGVSKEDPGRAMDGGEESSPPRLHLLVAQVDHRLSVRAMAKAPAELHGGFADLLAGGVLALMLEPNGIGAQPSQALVPIEGASLAQALENYFTQSEQLPTLIRLAAEGERLGGFMLQRLPLRDARGTEQDWEHLAILAATLTPQELLRADAATLLRRLFHEEDLRLFEPRPVSVACRCSRAGISRLLLSLGRTEADQILAEQGRIAVTCEFCGREYAFSRSEAAELFAAAGSVPSNTKH